MRIVIVAILFSATAGVRPGADDNALAQENKKNVELESHELSMAIRETSLRASVVQEVDSICKMVFDWDTQNKLPPWMSSITEGAEQAIAIVLGQSLNPDGSAPQTLKDRALKAKELLDHKKVVKVVVSGGDPANVGHTEASMMARVLEEVGVPTESIIRESQATTTAENAWFTLRWIPKGTGQIYIVTSDFHIARATYIFEETFNYFYKLMEDHYKDNYEWKNDTKRYPRLAVRQAATQSFCGNNNASLHAGMDINSKSLAQRAKDELGFLGSSEVSDSMFGAPLSKIMYIWPIQINVHDDPLNHVNFQNAMAQAMNAAQSLCVCKAPPEKRVLELPYPLKLPIPNTFPQGLTPADWQQVCPQPGGPHLENIFSKIDTMAKHFANGFLKAVIDYSLLQNSRG